MAPAMDAQAENPTTQVRLRTSPQAPPSPPPFPRNAEQGYAMWGFLDQQILMQVFTVLLTLLVVAVVRHVTAWWNGPDKPKGAPKNVDTPSTEASDGPKGSKEETQKDDKQGIPDTPAKPDKSKVVDDPVSSKTTGTPTSPPTTTPTGPGTNAGGADKKPDGAGATDSKAKATGADPAPTQAVTPQILMHEIQAVHKLLKSGADGGTSQEMKKEMDNLRKDVTTIMKFLSASDKDLKDISGRISAMETVLGAVNARVCTLSSNLDIHAKATESYLKEALKSISVIGGAAKTFHADTQVLIGAKHDNLEQGIKSCINKVTNCDYESHTALSRTLSDLSKQTYDMGQELLAALHFVQGEQGTVKDNLWQIANVLGDTVEQVRIIRDYCERPVPVNVQTTAPGAGMPPPPTYEPSIHGARQQLHLQTAIPLARGTGSAATSQTAPQVNIDMGDGRTINIPVHR